MVTSFFIGSHLIGGKPLDPYIIAEIGVNHEGDILLAKRLIKECADAGAHAAKFQSYKADKIASKHSPAYWDQIKEPTASQYKLFQKYDSFNASEYKELAEYCTHCGIDFMSTPFDLEAVDFLDPLMSSFKIASADITNVPLIRKCASKGKPIIFSTGASTLPEIEFAIRVAIDAGATNVALLHCVLNYPTPKENAILGEIERLSTIFPEWPVGYSDHVVPDKTISALEVAVLKGSVILEKHFTHDKTLPGNDHYHAMDKLDLIEFKEKLDTYKVLLGTGNKNLENETSARINARRSIVAAININKGDVISAENIIAKRPGHGISPIFWDEVIGKRTTVTITEDELIRWDMLVER